MPKPDSTGNQHLVDLLQVVAAAIRGAGAARVLAAIDSLSEPHVTVQDVIVRLRRLSRL
jgi:hypothetical protein